MAFFMDSFDLAIAPLVYIYLRQLNQLKILPWQYFLHFLPTVIFTIAMIPFRLKTSADKLEHFHISQLSNDWNWPSTNTTILILLLQFLLYSPLILFEYQRRLRMYENQVASHRNWLHWLMATCYGQWLVLGALAVLQYELEILHLILLGLLIFLLNISSFLLRQPLAILGIKPRAMVEESWRAQLSQDGLTHLAVRLHQYMHVSRCYLDADLTLTALADQMKTQPSRLSKVFSQHLDENFYDYINKHRVEAAKEMLIDNDRKHLSVTNIMALAGFNSNSVFYENFKRLTGQTPAKFRKEKTVKKPI